MAGFIAVHIGAGNHSSHLRKEYGKVCKAACKQGAKVLADGKSALDAATEAVSFLEDSPLSNAGFGSSLTWEGTVECDAGAMDGTSKYWGAAGAVSGIKNPCRLAREICIKQAKNDVLGRIQPCLLVGSGAEAWAKKNKITTIDPKHLIYAGARKKYKTYKTRVLMLEEHNKFKMMEQLDTVGAVCIDGLGHTAAVCSSGGIALKESGRIGQAAVFGAGCWAEDSSTDKPAVASCTTGCGEHLIRCTLAQKLALAAREQSVGSNNSAAVLNAAIKTHFFESPILSGIEERLCGALVLTCSPDGGSGEILWAHSTKTFILGHMEVHSVPKVVISSLQPGQKPGKGLAGGGTHFTLPALALVSDSKSVYIPQYTINVLN